MNKNQYMAKYKILETNKGTKANPLHFEPNATWVAIPQLNNQEIAYTSKGSTEKITEIDLNEGYAELGHLIDLNPAGIQGWSASTFVDLTKALTAQTETPSQKIQFTRSFLSGVTSVTNGNIANEKTMAMFIFSSNLKKFEADMPNLVDGSNMFFYCSRLTAFTSDMPKITTGNMMFQCCASLSEFNTPLNVLEKADGMFSGTNISNWTVDLPKLKNGTRMFTNSKINNWSVALPSLTNGNDMFSGCPLTTWNVALPQCTNTARMFANSKIETFNVDSLPLVEDANAMFYKATALTSFNSSMPSIIQSDLETEKGFKKMFDQCTSLTSVIITTTQAMSEYVTQSNLGLPSDNYTWTRTTESVGDLVKVTLIRQAK